MEDAYVADGSRNADLKQAIIDCSLEAGELSRMTAFVAVDETERVTDGADPHRITQPVEMPEGWQWNVCPLDRSLLIQMPGSGMHVDSFSCQALGMVRPESLNAADEFDAIMDLDAGFLDDSHRGRAAPLKRSRKPGVAMCGTPAPDAEAPVVRLVIILFAEAIQLRASHLVIVPQRGQIEIRFVIDGVEHERDHLPKRMLAAIIAHLKLLAKLDVTICDRLQSGFIETTVGNKPVRFVAHFAPQQFGEGILVDFSGSASDSETPEAVRNWWAANRLAEI